jgi:4-hydroxy-2-oxoheptanedioate aldolase
MELPKNSFKAALLEGRQQIGLWCMIDDPYTTEMLAGCGYDWMLIDTEHSPMDRPNALAALQAVAPYPVHPVVRPKSLDVAEIKKLLDCGAQSILVPYVQTVEEAELAAAAVEYAPKGIRGVAGLIRANRFGLVEDYATRAREEICLIVQIETAEACDRIEEIAAVPGIDAIFIGPADLAASLGHVGDTSHPEVRAMACDAVRRVRAAGKPAGFLTLDPKFLEEVVEAGSLFTAIDVDAAILRRGAIEQAKLWRKKTAS